MRGSDPATLDFSRIKRVSVLGSSGSGKSTLAMQLGEVLGIKTVHLDTLFWLPGWKERPEEDFQRLVHEATIEDEWVIDGNYSRAIDERFERANLVIYLDVSRYRCMYQAIRRRIQYHGKSRPDLTEGCPEQLDLEFAKWIWGYPKRSRPKMLARLENLSFRTPVVYIENASQRDRLIESVQRQMAHTA